MLEEENKRNAGSQNRCQRRADSRAGSSSESGIRASSDPGSDTKPVRESAGHSAQAPGRR